ncbi:uncharacterized protein TRIVIDRAFT_66788 [Trichoderma virens Gv29-8]|uniref:Uncharacterized protein n=1 Tax=Hypocrea virens (strain Gv29-8 / FGSC 10586) TaxID=413071 RepID=G9N368_HYPVG|nr:uncharacterized protein TRIVIDRAFT_66788 [Trichoderma virens Gv29-8]EHK18752.1 hypothetical protein TRIVIDRAFT_66788 [Trichoderma virens Gv29-8]UKZ56535.1 hypothetical protein TrVGV298_010372 [Trichoderma virens]
MWASDPATFNKKMLLLGQHKQTADVTSVLPEGFLPCYGHCLQGVPDEQSRHFCEINDLADAGPSTGADAEEQPTSACRDAKVLSLAIREPDATNETREESRLRISYDSLTRDLLAMYETLEQLKRRQLRRRSSVLLIYGFFVSLSML